MTREEAINQIKEWDLYSLTKRDVEALHTIAPELKESEDERTRKSLIKFLADIKKISERGRATWAVRKEDAEMCKSFINYLEEQKNSNDMAFHEGYTHGFDDGMKEKELKLAEWSEKHIADVFEKVGLAKIVREQGNDALTNALQDAMLELGKVRNAEWSDDYWEDDIQTRFAFYTYKEDPCVLYLSNVFVEESSRNHGFGTRILKAAEKVAEVIGATTISLKVKQNSPANTWYRKNGYSFVTSEDGYDWLKKNLEYFKPKKFEQEWSEEDKKNFYWISTRIQQANMTPEYSKEVYAVLDWLKSLLERFSLQPKQEWNDEDQKALERAIDCVRSWEIDYCDSDNRISERLKSFFERFNLQPKVEWSEEDSLTIADLINYFEGDSLECSTEEMVKRIKSLRPQYHGDVTMTEAYKMGFKAGKASSWKPSEQEKSALGTAIHVLTEERNFPKAAGHLQAILDAFEDKESRKDWKPSKEQMEALKNSAYGMYQTGDGPILRELHEQLKKLM